MRSAMRSTSGGEGGNRDGVVGFVWHGGGAQEKKVEEGAVVDVVEPGLIAMDKSEFGA